MSEIFTDVQISEHPKNPRKEGFFGLPAGNYFYEIVKRKGGIFLFQINRRLSGLCLSRFIFRVLLTLIIAGKDFNLQSSLILN